MNKCIECKNWRLRDENGKPLGMAQHHMGYCTHQETWRYYGGSHPCHTGRFAETKPELLKKRQNWAKR